MTKTNTTAFDALIADLNAAQARAGKDEHGIADMAAHIVRAVLDAEKGGNYPKLQGTVTRVIEKKKKEHVVTIDVAHLTKFAQGKLQQPEVTETFDALAGLAPKVQQARAEYAELVKATKGKSQLFAAELAAAKTKAHTITQQLRRPLRAAAALIVSDDYDAETVEAKTSKGSRVIFATRILKAKIDGKDTVTRKHGSVSTRDIDSLLSKIATAAGKAPAKRDRSGSKQNDTRNADAPTTAPVIAIDAKTFSKAPDRNTATVLHKIAEGVDDMETAFKPQERKEAITLILSLVNKLDAQAQAELMSELKKLKA